MYSTLQPFFRPELDELVGRRIDVLSSFEIKNEDGSHKEWKLRWCQGEVKRVYDNRKKPTVRVLWDAMPDCDGYEHNQSKLIKCSYNLNGTKKLMGHGEWILKLQ